LKNISNNETEINNLLKNYSKQNHTPQEVLENELHEQERNFKKRLKEKKKTMKNNYATFNGQLRNENQLENFGSNEGDIETSGNYNTTQNQMKELIFDDKEEVFN
jgi:hypothetical protein